MAVGCCAWDGPGNSSGVMGPSGISSWVTQTVDCSQRRNQSPQPILLSRVPWLWGRTALPGSQLNQPSGQAEKQPDALACGGPRGQADGREVRGPGGVCA